MAVSAAPIIVRKSRKKRGLTTHGGAWKVAFADFTLAMMAFFMVMWILEIADYREREAIVKYLNGTIVFDNGGHPFDIASSPFPIDFEGSQSLVKWQAPSGFNGVQALGTATLNHLPNGDQETNAGLGPQSNSIITEQNNSEQTLSALADIIAKQLQQAQLNHNMKLDIVTDGLRIRFQDNVEHQMFVRGRAEVTPYFEDLLLALSPILSTIDNSLILTGHTDSIKYSKTGYSNWELSSDRALAARHILAYGGINDQFVQVSGMADTVPVDKTNPNSASNRRIELLILTESAANKLNQMFDPHEVVTAEQPADIVEGQPTKQTNALSPVAAAQQLATDNQPISRLQAISRI
ncbi:flagellar motor protein MotB [Paraferrimonas sp. SM1919]|uniref:flagellar motor protein MotB n=1 Tax=Paraferrimonas sp. SM1919 TaxID=2662263 RepID=UPI0013D18C41|nr:flagellar motor protein MotB [Paraferrimonas sp. SM1919]